MTKQKKKGIFYSILVMFSQGWEGVIISTFALISAFAGIIATPAFASASLLAKELFTFLISLLLFGNKKIIQIFRKGISKTGFIYAIGFIIGSPIGNMFYVLSVTIAGPGYGTVLTSLYPIFTTLLLRIFLKDKNSKIVIFGMILTITSGALFLILPSLLSNEKFDARKIMGIGLGGFTALCWSIEGVILSYVNKRNDSWKDKELVIWKSSISLVFIATLVIPFTFIWGNGFVVFANIMSSSSGVLIALATAINLIIMRMFYTASIRNAGVKTTSIIDTNNFLVGPIIATIIYFAHNLTFANDSTKNIFEPLIWWSWLLFIPITIGVMLVIKFHKEHPEALDHEK